MAKAGMSLTLKTPHFRVVKGVIESFDAEKGLVFIQKKFRSSRRVRTSVLPQDLVFYTGKKGEEGSIGYYGEAIQPNLEDVVNVKPSKDGSFYHGSLNKDDSPVTFNPLHLSMLEEIHGEKRVRKGKLKTKTKGEKGKVGTGKKKVKKAR